MPKKRSARSPKWATASVTLVIKPTYDRKWLVLAESKGFECLPIVSGDADETMTVSLPLPSGGRCSHRLDGLGEHGNECCPEWRVDAAPTSHEHVDNFPAYAESMVQDFVTALGAKGVLITVANPLISPTPPYAVGLTALEQLLGEAADWAMAQRKVIMVICELYSTEEEPESLARAWHVAEPGSVATLLDRTERQLKQLSDDIRYGRFRDNASE